MSDQRRAESCAPPSSLLLDKQLCFALHSTSMAMNRIYRKLLRLLGVTYPQYLVLLVLWEHEALIVSEIGDRLFLDSATLTPLLKRMEAMGLVERRRAHEDQRQVVVKLTAAGLELRHQAEAVPEGVFSASECNEAELEGLREHLIALRAQLIKNA